MCPECLAEKEYCLHLALVQCLKPASHSRYDRIPVVVDQDNLLLKKVKPLPEHALEFRGGFVACHYYPDCWNGDTCRFAHSEFDRIVWSTKKFVLYGKPAWSARLGTSLPCICMQCVIDVFTLSLVVFRYYRQQSTGVL